MVKSMGPKGSDGKFSVDRLILSQVNDAIYFLQESVAPASDID